MTQYTAINFIFFLVTDQL